MKLLFAPIGFISGRIAGLTSRRLADRMWRLIDDRSPPRPDERSAPWPKLVAALLIEGAVFRVVSGITDQAARRWFARMTGRWPGSEPEHPDEPA
jgi:hypothetical protein